MHVQGLNAVLKAFRDKRKQHAKGYQKGLKLAGLFLQRKSQDVVPIDTGNLRASAGTRSEGQGWETIVIVFYTAYYAIFVHEKLEDHHAPGKIAKFLESPAREYRHTIVQIIVSSIQGTSDSTD